MVDCYANYYNKEVDRFLFQVLEPRDLGGWCTRPELEGRDFLASAPSVSYS